MNLLIINIRNKPDFMLTVESKKKPGFSHQWITKKTGFSPKKKPGFFSGDSRLRSKWNRLFHLLIKFNLTFLRFTKIKLK